MVPRAAPAEASGLGSPRGRRRARRWARAAGRCLAAQARRLRCGSRKMRSATNPRTGCPTTGPSERETMWKRVGAVGLVAALIGVGAVVLSGGRRSPPPVGTIAYSGTGLRDVFVARADGSRVRRLTSAPGPQFDPRLLARRAPDRLPRLAAWHQRGRRGVGDGPRWPARPQPHARSWQRLVAGVVA